MQRIVINKLPTTDIEVAEIKAWDLIVAFRRDDWSRKSPYIVLHKDSGCWMSPTYFHADRRETPIYTTLESLIGRYTPDYEFYKVTL